VHRLGRPDELAEEEVKEDAMPKGQYDRSKAKPRKAREAAPAAPGEPEAAKPEKVARKPRAKKAVAKKRRAAPARRAVPQRRASPSEAVFGVFEDGSVVINSPDCKGKLDHALADRLVKFIGKLQRK
jgi:hypothetical protein